MSTAAPADSRIDTFRHQAGMTRAVMSMNLEGVSHEESLVQPQPNGNCLNWVVGHLTCIYNNFLPLLGQQHVMDPAALARYDRGSPPISDPAEATDLQELLAAWRTATERVDQGLAQLDPEALDKPAGFSPSDNPNETIGSLISTVMFHQAYHTGQTGVLRRVSGHEGAVK